MTSKVSFTIRPPVSQRQETVTRQTTAKYIPHAVDSSDEDDIEDKIELVTGFDEAGIKRLQERPPPAGPLVIPALPNRDWRAIARGRKTQIYVPGGADVPVGADGSVGGLGTRDTINSGPEATGLVVREITTVLNDAAIQSEAQVTEITEVETGLDEDEKARRALLVASTGGENVEGIVVDAIPLNNNLHRPPKDETEAYQEDVITRPDSATLEDYERIPVSQFGAALLRGMGWKEGTAASRTRRGLVEPYLPTSRPSLLGLGAKERPPEDIPTGSGRSTPAGSKRPDRRYVPVARIRREDSARPTSSRSQSRSPPPPSSKNPSRLPSSGSASPYPEYEDRKRHSGDRNKDLRYSSSRRDRDRDRSKDRDGYSEYRSRRDKDRDRDRYDDRREKRDKDKSRDRERRE